MLSIITTVCDGAICSMLGRGKIEEFEVPSHDRQCLVIDIFSFRYHGQGGMKGFNILCYPSSSTLTTLMASVCSLSVSLFLTF